jgi:hypothetical protein
LAVPFIQDDPDERLPNWVCIDSSGHSYLPELLSSNEMASQRSKSGTDCFLVSPETIVKLRQISDQSKFDIEAKRLYQKVINERKELEKLHRK